MDIPADILTVLRCCSCQVVLGRGPVFQQHDGAAVCGRCVKPGQPASRNTVYEAAAKLLRFPCKNSDLGCKDTVAFSAEKEEIAHETACTYRQYLCPVVPAGRCDWLGRRREFVAHCRDHHPEQVLKNAAQVVHDITSSSLRTYLLVAFRTLFLLHTKICVTSGKVFHSVRYLGDPEKASKFSFTVDVKRGKQLISKSSPVAPSGCLAMQEDTSMAIYINSLLQMLDGFEGSTFTVTVWDDKTRCGKCSVELSQYLYFDDKNGWLCEHCAPARRACKNVNTGCTYMDIDKKCTKHELLSCTYNAKCPICSKSIVQTTLNAHYSTAHSNHTYRSGSVWQHEQRMDQIYLISTDEGFVRCRCRLRDERFEFVLTLPVHSEELYEFCCEIELTDPSTKISKKYTQEMIYSDVQDWHLIVENSEFPSNNRQFDICVTICRIAPE